MLNAIQKVCAILRVLAQSSPLRLTEIAEATSLNKATTLRILGSLIEKGFVNRVAGAKTYELGQEARVMAVSARRTVDIAELIDAAFPGMDGVGVPIRDDAGQVIAALSVGASSVQPSKATKGRFPSQWSHLEIGLIASGR